MADTAALVVALSAQLTRFEKDMKDAVGIADKRTKEIETRFSQMNGAITSRLQQLAATATGRIGFAGQLLGALGPLGSAAAVGIGAAVGAMLALASATAEYAARAKVLKEGAETAGFTIAQFKAIGDAGQRVGLDFKETTAFFTEYVSRIEQLRQGGGPLFDALIKIDVALLRQLSTTKDNVEAIDLLVAAFARLQDQAQKLDLAKAAGGRAGQSSVRLLDLLGSQGGASGVIANAPKIDEQTVSRVAQMRTDIDAIHAQTRDLWGEMFADTVLTHQKQASLEFQSIVKWLRDIVGLKERSVELDRQSANVPQITVNAQRGFRVNASDQALRDQPAPGAGSPGVELAILQRNIALLGEAVNVAEQWKLKRLEIAAAAEKGGIRDGVAERALAAFNLTMRTAALAARERLGVATEQEIVDVRLAQLAQDRIKFGLTENEVQQATVIILREAKEAADRLTVRQSYLPGLKQLELDAKNVAKGLDDFAVSGLNSLTDGLADIVTGTKSVSAGFHDMVNAILRDLARLLIRQSITAPLAGALGGLFSGGIGNGGALLQPINALASGYGAGFVGPIPGNAAGTDFWQGGPTWVGERGPELINLPRGSQVIPNAVAARGAGGGSAAVVNIYNNASGVEVKQERRRESGTDIIDVVIARVDSEMARGRFDKTLGARHGLRPITALR